MDLRTPRWVVKGPFFTCFTLGTKWPESWPACGEDLKNAHLGALKMEKITFFDTHFEVKKGQKWSFSAIFGHFLHFLDFRVKI